MIKEKLLLGKVLQQANLVSSSQIEAALRQQSQQSQQSQHRIGEILADQGWIKQGTVDFFAEQWNSILSQTQESERKPIGFYFQLAHLLNQSQISSLLVKQKEIRPWVRFGELAVSQGLLNQKTVDFFVEHLYPENTKDSGKIYSDAAQLKLVQAKNQDTEKLINWLCKKVSIASLTFSLGLLADIVPRFLTGGPDLAGTLIVSVQSVFTLLAGKSIFTQEEQEAERRIFSRLVDRRFWQAARAIFPLLLFLFLAGFWLCLPQIGVWYNRRGLKHYHQEQWSSAKFNYERALKLYPDFAEAHFHLGVLYEDLQNFAKAHTEYQLALQNGSDKKVFAGASNNLARLYILKSNYSAAVSLLKELQLRLQSKGEVELLYSLNKNLGWARFKQSRLAEAEAKLLEAIELAEKAHLSEDLSAAAHCLLAQVLEAQNLDLDKEVPSKQSLQEWEKCLAYSSGKLPEEDEWIGMAMKRLNP